MDYQIYMAGRTDTRTESGRVPPVPISERHLALGEAIAEERTRRELSQSEMARRTGMSLFHYTQIETGRVNASASKLWAVADGLGIRLAVLIDRAEPAP